MGIPDFINGLGNRGDRIFAVADAHRRGLTREEEQLASCAGGGASIEDVIHRSGMPEARAIALLLGMRLRGVINPGVRDPRASPPAPSAARPAPPFASAAPAPRAAPASVRPAPLLSTQALAEDVELDEPRKREILELEARCGTDDHFSILGLTPGADAAAAKKAYYELTRRFHPDRYFGKRLGSYKDRIDKVFKRLTEAQAVLSDANRRKEYLDAHPELAPAAAPRSALEEERASERRSRLVRHPYLAKHAKLFELVTRGRVSLEKGEFARAFTDLNLAAQIDPNNRDVAEMLKAAKRGGDRSRAQGEFDEARRLENMGDGAGAIRRLRSACSLDPDHAEAAHRLSLLLLHEGGEAELKEGHQHARRASELSPNNPDFRLTFARLLLRVGLEKNAIRELEAVLKLRPGDAFAKEQLRKLKWKL